MDSAPPTFNFFCCVNVKRGTFIFSMFFFGYSVSDWVALLTDKKNSSGYATLWSVENTCLLVSSIFLFVGSVKESLPCLSLFLLFGGSELFLVGIEWFLLTGVDKGLPFEIVYEWFVQICLIYLLIVVSFYMSAITNSKNLSIALNQVLTEELDTLIRSPTRKTDDRNQITTTSETGNFLRPRYRFLRDAKVVWD